MASKVTLKVVQYKVADSLDKIRLPTNPVALVTKNNNSGGKCFKDIYFLSDIYFSVCIKFNRPRFLNCMDSSVIMPVSAALR